MQLEKLIHLSKFELSLMYVREMSEHVDVAPLLAKTNWARAVSDPASVATMEWKDFNRLRNGAYRVISKHLKEASEIGDKIRDLICNRLKICNKLGLPVIVLAREVADALKDTFGEATANIITALLISHVSLSLFCKCHSKGHS